MMEKFCTRCKCEKPRSEFTKDSYKADGLRAWCRSCCKETEAGKPHNREKLRIRDARKVVPKDRLRAKNAVRTALRKGDLTKWPVCAVPECSVSSVEAHHPDYSAPVDVVWLCTSHHRLAHYAAKEPHV